MKSATFSIPWVVLSLSTAFLALGESALAKPKQDRQGFMLGLPPAHDLNLGTTYVQQLQSFYRPQLERLHKEGANLVRYQIWLQDSPANLVGTRIEDWKRPVKQIVKMASELGMTTVVDLHKPRLKPKVAKQLAKLSGDEEALKSRLNSLGANDYLLSGFANDWDYLAKTLQGVGRDGLVWYDLWNEPPGNVRPTLRKAALNIRKYGSRRQIQVPHVGSTLQGVNHWKPLKNIDNQSFTGHLWNWETTQLPVPDGVDENSWIVPYGSEGREFEDLERIIGKVNRVHDNFEVPIYIGEVGVVRNREYAFPFLRDFLTILNREENDHISYSLHAFDEADVWRYENEEWWPDLMSLMRKETLPLRKQLPRDETRSGEFPEPSSLFLAILAASSLAFRRTKFPEEP